MSVEAYIPSEATFAGLPLPEPLVLALYEFDGDGPHGALTTPYPLHTGQRGVLEVIALRDGRCWQLTFPEIEVYRHSAVGFEFRIRVRAKRRLLEDEPDQRDRRESA